MKKYIIFKSLSSKKIIILLIIMAVTLILLWAGIKQVKVLEPLKVKPGVIYLGEEVGGLKQEEVISLVTGKVGEVEQPPVDAVVDPVNGGVIPELNGLMVDIQATAEKILRVDSREVVSPVTEIVEPQKTLKDFPNAPLYRGNPEKNEISFLINVAWGNEYMEDMLEVLDRYQVSCTYFFVGKWAEKNPDMVRQIISRGHEAANHGYRDSVLMSQLSSEEMKEDIQKTNEVLRELTGSVPQFFSSHCGELNQDLLEVTAGLNMRTVMWSLDTVDWMLPGVKVMVDKVLGGAHNGATVLMHPTEQTPEALEIIIQGLEEQGYQLVPLSRLIDPDYYSENL
ncbi:polysaccharide deacetylase family protein [Candidatus Contubernalis alkaliaceticus]|uniref:polysaccharide deacetylase family protein n=1 Tax=Candidatus Contubernalis alkaliaceticus TaxID=338645 RepID=UPI001F4C0C35|nr:polysaccharide deacetylase family protein [Candidatus Contubernalis alkalaceticus]UNC91845.1 polysaccharide deacetylase family protein [Candidatus Contubernalis alkalaceticus]